MKDSGCLTAILLLAAVGLLGPILVFGIGWVGGAILRWAFGDMIASGMNLLFIQAASRRMSFLLPAAHSP